MSADYPKWVTELAQNLNEGFVIETYTNDKVPNDQLVGIIEKFHARGNMLPKFIIVIKGTTEAEYKLIRQDIIEQLEAQGIAVPIFARLPADYTEVEIVWMDEDIEKETTKHAIDGVRTRIN